MTKKAVSREVMTLDHSLGRVGRKYCKICGNEIPIRDDYISIRVIYDHGENHTPGICFSCFEIISIHYERNFQKTSQILVNKGRKSAFKDVSKDNEGKSSSLEEKPLRMDFEDLKGK